MNDPQQICVDRSGTVYVADYGNHRIMRWLRGATAGTIIVGGNNYKGAEADQLDRPIGLSVDRQGNLYVADSINHRVQKFLVNVDD